MRAGVAQLSDRMRGLRMPDLEPVRERLANLERIIAAFRIPEPDFRPIERSLDGLQSAVRDIPQPDLAPVVDTMLAIDSRLDLGALENRLTAIEYGLAALHDMLRSRSSTQSVSYSTGNSSADLRLDRSELLQAPARPPRAQDPINPFRRPGDEANLLLQPAFGAPDDLGQIEDVGPILKKLLNDIGVYYFWQIAEWTRSDIAHVDERLKHFRGRIERDGWIDQARRLAARPGAADRPRGH